MRSLLATSLVVFFTLTACVEDEQAERPPLSGNPTPGGGGGGSGGGGDLMDGGSGDGGPSDGGLSATPLICAAITPGGANDLVLSPPLLGFEPTFAFAAFPPDQCVSGAPLLQIGITGGPCMANPETGLWLRFYEGSVGDTVTVSGPGVNTDGLIFIDFYDGLGNRWCNDVPTFANNIIFDELGLETGDPISTSVFEVASLPRCGGSTGPEEISLSIPTGLLDVTLSASLAQSCL